MTDERDKILYIEGRSDFLPQIQKWTADLTQYELLPSPDLGVLVDNPPKDLKPRLILLDGRRAPLECLEWSQTLKMAFSAPIIVFYDIKTELNFNDLKKNGASALLHYYFDSEFVVDKILELAPWQGEGPPPLCALNPISLEDLSSEMDLNFDLYVHLPGNQKSILVRKKGSPIDEKLISKAKDSKQNLYFKKSEMRQFMEYSRTALSLKNSDLAMSVTDKIIRVRERIQQIVSHFFNQESKDFAGGRAIFENCEKIVQDLGVSSWKSKEEVMEAITVFSGRPRTYYNDVITLCVMAAGFGYLLNKSKEEVNDLALAGLLHNVGLAFMQKPALQLSLVEEADKREFFGYPERSINQVKTKRVPLSPRVTELIWQHREHTCGGGFPRGTPVDKHDPLSKVMQIAYRILEMTQLQNEKPGHTLPAAFEQLNQEMLKQMKVDGPTLLSLKKIFCT